MRFSPTDWKRGCSTPMSAAVSREHGRSISIKDFRMKTIRFIYGPLSFWLGGRARRFSSALSRQARRNDVRDAARWVLPAYAIAYRGKTVVHESRLGFEPDLTSGFPKSCAHLRSRASRVGSQCTANAVSSLIKLFRVERRTEDTGAEAASVSISGRMTKAQRCGTRCLTTIADLSLPKRPSSGSRRARGGYEEHGTEGASTSLSRWVASPLSASGR
jgi:hypothetical protein